MVLLRSFTKYQSSRAPVLLKHSHATRMVRARGAVQGGVHAGVAAPRSLQHAARAWLLGACSGPRSPPPPPDGRASGRRRTVCPER